MEREGGDGVRVVVSGVLGCITSSVSIPSGDGAGGVVSTGGPHVFLPPGGCGRPTQPRHSHLRAGCWTSSSQGTGLWAGQSGRGVLLEVSCYCLRLSRSRGGAPPIAGEAHNSQCVRGPVRSCTGCVAIPPCPAPRFLLSMLEHVVLFLLSQSTCCLAHPRPALEAGRRELLARELASELVGERLCCPQRWVLPLPSPPTTGNLPLWHVSLLLSSKWTLPLSGYTVCLPLAAQVPQPG